MRTEYQYMSARDRCRANLQIPDFVRHWDYEVKTDRSGDEVLETIGVSMAEAINDPSVLLRNDLAYAGGSSTKLDPFHPATRSLIALRLSAGTWDEETIETAFAMASEALAEHGVPPEIDDVYAIGDRAENFSVGDVIGALYAPPTDRPQRRSLWAWILRRDRPAVPAAHWAARTDAAYTMIGARVAMPAHHHARTVVTEYVDAVCNPLVSGALVENRGIEVGQILTEAL